MSSEETGYTMFLGYVKIVYEENVEVQIWLVIQGRCAGQTDSLKSVMVFNQT